MMPMIDAITILADVAFEHADANELLALYDAAAVAFATLCPERAKAARSAAVTLRDAQKCQLEFRTLLTVKGADGSRGDAGPERELSAEHRRRGGIFAAETRGERAGRMLADFDLYREDRGAAGMQALDVHSFSCVWTIGKEKNFTRPQFEDALRQAEDDAGLLSTAGC